MRYQGVAYRAHNPKWSWSPVSGEGARLHGGRFNPKGVAALYLSLTSGTAVLEASQGFGKRFPPLTLVTYDVDCEDIIDLTRVAVRTRHKVSATDLSCAWALLAATGALVPSWIAATRLMDGGAAGAIVQSYADGATGDDKNLVLWRWSDALPHKATVFDPGRRLPRNASSWEG